MLSVGRPPSKRKPIQLCVPVRVARPAPPIVLPPPYQHVMAEARAPRGFHEISSLPAPYQARARYVLRQCGENEARLLVARLRHVIHDLAAVGLRLNSDDIDVQRAGRAAALDAGDYIDSGADRHSFDAYLLCIYICVFHP